MNPFVSVLRQGLTWTGCINRTMMRLMMIRRHCQVWAWEDVRRLQGTTALSQRDISIRRQKTEAQVSHSPPQCNARRWWKTLRTGQRSRGDLGSTRGSDDTKGSSNEGCKRLGCDVRLFRLWCQSRIFKGRIWHTRRIWYEQTGIKSPSIAFLASFLSVTAPALYPLFNRLLCAW